MFKKKGLFGPAHEELAMAYSFYGNHAVCQAGKLVGLAHDGCNMQAGSLRYIVLGAGEDKVLVGNLNLGYPGTDVGTLLVIYYEYGAGNYVVALPFLFGHILFYQETDGLRTIGKTLLQDIGIQGFQQLIFQ